MRAIGLFLLFLGAILVTKGVVQSGQGACPPANTHIKFIPRSLYEEQLARPVAQGIEIGSSSLSPITR